MSRRVRTLGLLMDACLVLFLVCSGVMMFSLAVGHWGTAFINVVIGCFEVWIYRLYASLIEQQINIEKDFGELMRRRGLTENV